MIKGEFGEFAGFYRWDAKKQAAWTRLFFCDQADLKRYSRLKNQSASIDGNGSAGFFLAANTPRKKIRRVGVNKRNWGYPAAIEFVEHPLRVRSVNSLGFTAGMQKTSGLDPLVFLRPSGFEKI